ncbi:hypothetical protein ACH3XW_46145 [Acanthocheilonema viteae]
MFNNDPSCNAELNGLYGSSCSNKFYINVLACNSVTFNSENTPAVKLVSNTFYSDNMNSIISRVFVCRATRWSLRKGCAREVTLCLSGKTVKFQCPDLLKYDTECMFTAEFTPHGAYAQGCTAECVMCRDKIICLLN